MRIIECLSSRLGQEGTYLYLLSRVQDLLETYSPEDDVTGYGNIAGV